MHAPSSRFVRFAAVLARDVPPAVRARGIRSAPCIALATLIGAACAASAAAQAQSPAPDVAACVYRSNIDHTRILDDRNILFFMRDHSIYQNVLKDPCYGLKITKRFAYGEASMHRLCMGNLIAVLEDVTPGAVSRNNLCKLGLFVPVDKEVVDDLISAADSSSKKGGDRRPAIKVEPVELPSPPESSVGASPPPSHPATEPAPASGAEPAPAAPER